MGAVVGTVPPCDVHAAARAWRVAGFVLGFARICRYAAHAPGSCGLPSGGTGGGMGAGSTGGGGGVGIAEGVLCGITGGIAGAPASISTLTVVIVTCLLVP